MTLAVIKSCCVKRRYYGLPRMQDIGIRWKITEYSRGTDDLQFQSWYKKLSVAPNLTAFPSLSAYR